MPGKKDFGWLHEVSPTFRNRNVKYEKIRADKQYTSLMQQKEGKKNTS